MLYEELTDPLNRNKVIEQLEKVTFNQREDPELIAELLNELDEYYDPVFLLDDMSRRVLPTIVKSNRSTISKPDVLLDWQGRSDTGTEEIHKIANGEVTNTDVEAYQRKMRSKLPTQIPLVRGVSTTSPPLHGDTLTSWTSSINTASIFGDSLLLYTVAKPENVFMCSQYGETIGDQEYTLSQYTVEEIYNPTLENKVKIVQKMYSVLF